MEASSEEEIDSFLVLLHSYGYSSANGKDIL